MNKIIRQWNEAAGKYSEDQEQSEYAAFNKAFVKERFRVLKGERVLDLGCGYGYYTEYFRSIGGSPVGIDGAQTMIDIAQKTYPECSFSVGDITKILPFGADSFDIVFCNQVLMDIEDIQSVLAECHRILKRDGVFYYSIVHPAFYGGTWETDRSTGIVGKMISSYVTPKVVSNHFWGDTVHFHRPLSFYLNAASDVGFMLLHTEEPKVYRGNEKNADLPLFFFAEYKK